MLPDDERPAVTQKSCLQEEVLGLDDLQWAVRWGCWKLLDGVRSQAHLHEIDGHGKLRLEPSV